MARTPYTCTVADADGNSHRLSILLFSATKGADLFLQVVEPVMRDSHQALRLAVKAVEMSGGDLGDLEDLESMDMDAMPDVMAPLSVLAGNIIQHIRREGGVKLLKRMLSEVRRWPEGGDERNATSVASNFDAIYTDNYMELLETVVHVLLANYKRSIVGLGKRLSKELGIDLQVVAEAFKEQTQSMTASLQPSSPEAPTL